MGWVKCLHTREDINRAWKSYAALSSTDPARDPHLEVIDNWRSCHGYPLHIVTKTLKSRAQRIDPVVLVARRIKRLSSITIKLQHNESMRLSQMQDIGGCRAVMASVLDVERLVKTYEVAARKSPNRGLVLGSKADYIEAPKDDGYRSVHLIIKFRSSRKTEFDGQKIEIQVRSRLQHAWATAVETCQAFTGQAMKTKLKTADPKWLRFFALMSSSIAAREKSPLVPNTPSSSVERTKELREINKSEKILELLSGWRKAIQLTSDVEADAFAFVLELDTLKRVLRVKSYKENDIADAQAFYLSREKATEGMAEVQVVLVSTDSIKSLKKAYPNYYMDTSRFVTLANQELGIPSKALKPK